MKKKGTLGATVDTQIRQEISAVENFLRLNKLTNNSRKIVPFTSSKQPFVAYSERELVSFIWKRRLLRERMEELAREDHTLITSATNLEAWISGKEPGYVIKQFICDVAPQGLTNRQRKMVGHRAAVRLLSLNEIGAHLDVVKDKNLDPSQYKERGYVLRGSIRTNGFRVQLIAFKLRELQDVRYRRLPENRLPCRLTSTVGGTDYYLKEIRNLLTSQVDIARLWPGMNIEDIRILTLDAGQACAIGGFAHLPTELATKSNSKEPVKNNLPMEEVSVASQQPAVGAVVQDATLPVTALESVTSTPMRSP